MTRKQSTKRWGGNKVPTYSYKCECGNTIEVVKPMSSSNTVETCQFCFKEMQRDFAADMPRVHSDSYSKPVHSDALAIHPSQRAEHQQRYPYMSLDKHNRPILDSFSKAERYYEDRGLVKPSRRKEII